MDRATLLRFWNEAWDNGLWAASWRKSVADLTPEQAAWKPADGRHSIWQIVAHMIFWREDALCRLKDARRPSDQEVAKLNFAEPSEADQASWQASIDRLADTQRRVAAAMADEAASLERLSYLLPHDCYHFGQINYVRALLDLKPIE